jgi:hypothetical protein
VKVIHFITRETMEERILELQEMKRKIADGALNGTGGVASLQVKDLRLLFRAMPQNNNLPPGQVDPHDPMLLLNLMQQPVFPTT